MVSTWAEVSAPDARAAAVASCSRTSRAARTSLVAAARDMLVCCESHAAPLTAPSAPQPPSASHCAVDRTSSASIRSFRSTRSHNLRDWAVTGTPTRDSAATSARPARMRSKPSNIHSMLVLRVAAVKPQFRLIQQRLDALHRPVPEVDRHRGRQQPEVPRDRRQRLVVVAVGASGASAFRPCPASTTRPHVGQVPSTFTVEGERNRSHASHHGTGPYWTTWLLDQPYGLAEDVRGPRGGVGDGGAHRIDELQLGPTSQRVGGVARVVLRESGSPR